LVAAPAWLERAWELVLPASIALLTLVAYRWAKKRGREPEPMRLRSFAQLTACVLLAIFCTAKVLSPQYLIWGLPLLVILPEREGAWTFRAFVAALALTQLVYPIGFELVRAATLPGVLLLLARNTILVIMLGRSVLELVPHVLGEPTGSVPEPALLPQPEE
jgi:hypothetical protein